MLFVGSADEWLAVPAKRSDGLRNSEASDGSVRIGPARLRLGVLAYLTAGSGVVTLARGVEDGEVLWAVLLATFLAALAWLCGRVAFMRGPALLVTREAIIDRRRGVEVRWADVSRARLDVRQGAFMQHHELVLVTAASEVSIQLDQLAEPWQRVAEVVSRHSGLEIKAES